MQYYAIVFTLKAKTQKKKIADNCIGRNMAIDNRALQKSKLKK